MIKFIAKKTQISTLDVKKMIGNFRINDYSEKEVGQVLDLLMSAELIMIDTIDMEKASNATKKILMTGFYNYLATEDDIKWDKDLIVVLCKLLTNK